MMCSQMASIDAAVVMQLVDNNVFQVFEQLRPLWCVCGRIPVCSMSGFVNTMLARWRMARRASCGVSPS